MMSLSTTATLAVLCAVLCVAVGQSAPTPPVWPSSFNVAFNTTIDGAFGYKDAPSMMYYDWPSYNQRLDHDKCPIPIPGVDQIKCTFLFKGNVTWVMYPFFGTRCCQLFEVGMNPPTIFQSWKYEGTDNIRGIDCQKWVGANNFTYWNKNDKSQEAVHFVDGFTKGIWDWNRSFNVGPQNQTLFDLPSQCKSKCALSMSAAFTKIPSFAPMRAYHAQGNVMNGDHDAQKIAQK